MFEAMLKKVLQAFGPSGNEGKVASVLAEEIRPYCDEVYTDALGNLIAHKRGTSGKKLMLSAHMDQIGFIVVDIDENGFCASAMSVESSLRSAWRGKWSLKTAYTA